MCYRKQRAVSLCSQPDLSLCSIFNLSLTYCIVSCSFPSIVPANGPVSCVIVTV